MKQMTILLVEDNAGDVDLMREALRETGSHPDLHVVPDGVEALRFLRRQEPYAAAPRPELILLDLNLPKRDGREVLEDLRRDPDLGSIPLVVWTSSPGGGDFHAQHGLRPECYRVKPIGYEPYVEAVRDILTLWRERLRNGPRWRTDP